MNTAEAVLWDAHDFYDAQLSCGRSNFPWHQVSVQYHFQQWKYIFQVVKLFKSYFGGDFSEQSIKGNFVLIYELLDETLDYGYPQVRRFLYSQHTQKNRLCTLMLQKSPLALNAEQLSCIYS